VLIQPLYNFFANGHIQSFLRNIPKNEILLALIRPVNRKKFFDPLEKCVGHSLKLLDKDKKLGLSHKPLHPLWRLKLVMGLVLIKMETERSGQSKN